MRLYVHISHTYIQIDYGITERFRGEYIQYMMICLVDIFIWTTTVESSMECPRKNYDQPPTDFLWLNQNNVFTSLTFNTISV